MPTETYKKAEKFYTRLLKRLSPRAKGKIVAVEPDSKRYVLGEDELKVALKAQKMFPNKLVGFFRVGYPAVHKVRQSQK